MPVLHFTHPDGYRETARFRPGETVRDVAVAEGIGMEISCGGALVCAECHILVDPPWADRLPALLDDERQRLRSEADAGPRSRLGCQVELTLELDGLEVRMMRGYAPD